jgi:hypothetical protein
MTKRYRREVPATSICSGFRVYLLSLGFSREVLTKSMCLIQGLGFRV